MGRLAIRWNDWLTAGNFPSVTKAITIYCKTLKYNAGRVLLGYFLPAISQKITKRNREVSLLLMVTMTVIDAR